MSGPLLVPARDEHFAWMLGEAPAPDGLRRPPGGVDEPWVFTWLRRNLKRHGGGSWLMIVDGEVVGMCSHKTAPDGQGAVEIGYGVASERRRLGYASRAVAEVIVDARADPRIRTLTAGTALANAPSQKVLANNGFALTGEHKQDADEGEVVVWALAVS